MAAQAEKDGLDKDPETAAQLAACCACACWRTPQSQKYLKGKEPTDAELHAEYDTAIAAWTRPSITPGTSWSPTKEQAEQLIKKIKGGAKFEDLAKAESTDSSKANGGDLGWFTPSRMVKPFADAVKAPEEGRDHRRSRCRPSSAGT